MDDADEYGPGGKFSDGSNVEKFHLPGSTSTWNPERTFPWLGDSEPCPTKAERLVQLAEQP